MRMSWIIPLFAFLTAEAAMSVPTKLNCTTESLPNAQTFTIQIYIEKKQLELGDIPYDIVQISDNYISAIEKSDGTNVGGEVFVINRTTGRFKRAAVYLAATAATFLNPAPNPLETAELTAKTFSGTCAKPVL